MARWRPRRDVTCCVGARRSVPCLPGTCRARPCAKSRSVGQHRRGHATGHVCRRHGRGTRLGDFPDPRKSPHLGAESRTQDPHRRRQRGAAAVGGAAQSARPAYCRMGLGKQETRADRDVAHRERRPGRARCLPRFRPLADAALGGGARACRSGTARKGEGLRSRHRIAGRGAARSARAQERRTCARAFRLTFGNAAKPGQAENREPAARRRL